MRRLGLLEVVEDRAQLSEASGWVQLATARPARVRTLVPDGFGAYAAVAHPAIGIEEPSRMQDTLGQALTRALCDVLARFTTTADRCWCAVWDGYADMIGLRSDLTLPRLTFGHTSVIVARGTLSAVPERSLNDGGESSVDYRSPTLWWPADRAWCVATDYEMDTTFVGATANCVAALLDDERLDVTRVTAGQALSDVVVDRG